MKRVFLRSVVRVEEVEKVLRDQTPRKRYQQKLAMPAKNAV